MKPLSINDTDFTEEVLNADELVLVYFWTPRSQTCRTISSILDSIGNQFDREVKIVKVDIELNKQAATDFGVGWIPQILFFAGGRIVDRELTVSFSEEEMIERIQRLLSVQV
ncbi:MAG: thiol reductase thioredoxin [Bacteroidota bacterium]|nr:thiol reductase thioredoxin [Bacteroidota bacterium]